MFLSFSFDTTNKKHSAHRMLYWIEGEEVKGVSLTAPGAPSIFYNLPAQVGRFTVGPRRTVFYTRDGQLGTSDSSLDFRYVYL